MHGDEANASKKGWFEETVKLLDAPISKTSNRAGRGRLDM